MSMWKKRDDGSALTQPIPAGWNIVDLGLLGQGGMSRVYRVRDESLGRDVAFKVLRPELLKNDEAYDSFVREARITAQLDHPNIPPLYALSTEKKKSTCFTMKVLEAQPRRDAEALIPIIEILVRVCDAVAFAHSRGILHLDLKPGNVMVGAHGQIYVVDWGLAQRINDLPTPERDDHRCVGTPAYMAPEQARGQNYALDERTDVFLIGGMLYRILVGRPPYAGATADDTLVLAQQGHITSPDVAVPNAGPRRLVAICMRALATDPAQRYQQVSDLRADLEDFIRGTAHLPQQTFKAGEAIVREGEPGDRAYVILDGHCQASRVVAGKTQLLKLLGPGEMFGETAVLTGSPRQATVTALMDSTVAVVDRSFFQEEMERTSLIALAIRAVAGSFLDVNGQTAALLQEQAASRAVDLALRELVFNGRTGNYGVRWVPWKALLDAIVKETGLDASLVTDRVARAPGFEVDARADRVTLKPPA